MILIAFRLKTIPRQFKFDLDIGYKLALTYVKQILSVLKEMIIHASETTSWHDVTTSWHDVTTSQHDVTTSQHDVTSCQIQEQRGFLKYVCKSGTSTYNKCHNSEETYYDELGFFQSLSGEICSNDPFFYQACDKALGGRVTNVKFLCEYYLCESSQRVYLSISLEAFTLICNGYPDCASGIDETNCPNTTTIMPSGRVIFSDYICNDVCDD